MVQEYLAHKRLPPLARTLQHAYACGPMVVPGVGRLLMSEVPLWGRTQTQARRRCIHGGRVGSI